MKNEFWLLTEFIKRFGVIAGSGLFLQFKRKKLENLNIPNIKYELFLRKDTADIQTFFQVFLGQEYEFDWTIKPKVIVDCGSHIGLFTVFMKNKFPDAKIICIEPDEENFKSLKKNTSQYENIFYENCGIWSKETNLKVTDKFNLGNWAMVAEEDNESGSVKAISIDYLMKKYEIEQIDILKLDIESSEKEIFKNNYSDWLSKTKIVAIELHDWMEEGCSKPFFEAINRTFNSYGYFTGTENTVVINNDLD